MQVRLSSLCRTALVALGLAWAAATAHAQTIDDASDISLAIGPAPTSSALNALNGPFAVSTSIVVLPVGFGGGTIYYPTQAGKYGVIALCPGFTATSTSLAWLARRLASWGFVVVNMNTVTVFDFPSSRATEMRVALRYATNWSSATVRARIDPNRQAVAGHSMGGGGALIAAVRNPELKAAYALMPWSPTYSPTSMKVPTMLVAADADTIAPAALMVRPYYKLIPATVPKAYAELRWGNHFSPILVNTPIGRYGAAWMKRFVDGDTRYQDFLCGAAHQYYANALVFASYLKNCPY